MRIVCVDDHPVLLFGMMRDIKKLCPAASVAAFLDAEEALEHVRQSGCDVLFSEVELYGGESGLTLAREVQRLCPTVNLIFVSACSAVEHARELLALHPSAYLTKVLTREDLKGALEHLKYPVA